MGYKASKIVKTAYDTVMGKYGRVWYRRFNRFQDDGYAYNVGKYHDGIWSFDCLGFVHTMVNGFEGDTSKLGGGAVMDDFVNLSNENVTLYNYCSTRGNFPVKSLKPASLLKMSGHVGLYIGEHYVPEIDQTINCAEVTCSMGAGGKFSWVDLNTGDRYTEKGGTYLATWTDWGEFDRVDYDGGMPEDEEEDETPVVPVPTTDLVKGDRGIDLSYHQGEANWLRLRGAGVKFAIIREGWGEDCNGKGVDPGFFDYVKGAVAEGIKVMVYHFLYGVNETDAIENAKCAIKNVEKAGLDKNTIIWLDLEYDIVDDAAKDYRGNVKLTNEMQRKMAETFCDYILSKGYPTGIYTNYDYITRVLGRDILEKYDIWLADLEGDDDFPCVIRQYDWYSKYDGISVNVDKDVYRGIYTVGTALPKGDVPVPTPEPTPTPYDVTKLAFEIYRGVWGRNPERERDITEKYGANSYRIVQDKVNLWCERMNFYCTVLSVVVGIMNGYYGTDPQRKEEIVEKYGAKVHRKAQDYVNDIVKGKYGIETLQTAVNVADGILKNEFDVNPKRRNTIIAEFDENTYILAQDIVNNVLA